jgi:Terpene synthase family 2, C-terminal metal binding
MDSDTSWLPEIVGQDSSHIVARSRRQVDRLKQSLAEHLRDTPRLLESLPAVAALVAAAAPWADDNAIYLASRMNLWVFMIDDRFDTSSGALKDLDLLAAGCAAVAEGSAGTTSGDPVLLELANLRRALRAHRMFDTLGRQWAQGVSRMVRAMLQEWRWAKDFRLAGRAALPSFDAYLDRTRLDRRHAAHLADVHQKRRRVVCASRFLSRANGVDRKSVRTSGQRPPLSRT